MLHRGLPTASSQRSVQRNLEVQSLLARGVTVDNEVGMKTWKRHTLNVYGAFYKRHLVEL